MGTFSKEEFTRGTVQNLNISCLHMHYIIVLHYCTTLQYYIKVITQIINFTIQPTINNFTKNTGMEALQCGNLDDLRKKVAYMRSVLSPSHQHCKPLYSFIFTLTLEESQKQLPKMVLLVYLWTFLAHSQFLHHFVYYYNISVFFDFRFFFFQFQSSQFTRTE